MKVGESVRSGEIVTAALEGGGTIEFVYDANAPRGGMKHTFFTPDRKYAVQFFNDPEDGMNPNIQDRIRTIVGVYNPTLSEERGGGILPQPILLAGCDSQQSGVRHSVPGVPEEVLFR